MDIKSINNSFINGFIPNCLFYNASSEYNICLLYTSDAADE